MAEKQCPKCKMMIDNGATKCPHCRSTMGTSPAVKLLAIVFVVFGVLYMIGSSSSPNDKEILKEFMYKCFDLYPNDADICVHMALGRKFKYEDVEDILKQHIANHPQKKDKKK